MRGYSRGSRRFSLRERILDYLQTVGPCTSTALAQIRLGYKDDVVTCLDQLEREGEVRRETRQYRTTRKTVVVYIATMSGYVHTYNPPPPPTRREVAAMNAVPARKSIAQVLRQEAFLRGDPVIGMNCTWDSAHTDDKTKYTLMPGFEKNKSGAIVKKSDGEPGDYNTANKNG